MARRIQALPIVAAGALMLPATAQAAERLIVVELPERGRFVVRMEQPPEVALADIDLSALGSRARALAECRADESGPAGLEPCPEGVPVRSLDELARELAPPPPNRSEREGRAGGEGSGSTDRSGSADGSRSRDRSTSGNRSRSGSRGRSDSRERSRPADRARPKKTTPTPTATPTPAPSATPTPTTPTLPAPRTLPNPPSADELSGWRTPLFLIPIYRAAAARTGVSWTTLAAINSIETDYGRNRGVSTAGAVGWMQFMPSTWLAYATDATGDRRADPLSPADAIFSAARYLQAAGAAQDLETAVFAYNHADWYVRDVLERARELERLPDSTVAALTELALARPPVEGKVLERSSKGAVLRAQPGAIVSAPRAGRVVKIGRNERLGRYVIFADTAGNRYTIGGLASIADRHATVGRPRTVKTSAAKGKQRLFANPSRPAAYQAGGERQLRRERRPSTLRDYLVRRDGVRLRDLVLRDLRPGARVLDGTVLGRAGTDPIRLEIRPAGKHGPRIDPVPIMRQWRLLDHAAGGWADDLRAEAAPAEASLLRADAATLSRRVLDDPRIDVYPCGRDDVAAGRADKRVLATLLLLADAGLRPTVTSLQCGHSKLTTSGNVSEHFTGDAVDISAINGVPVLGHQGPGSLVEQAARRLLSMEGELRPHQVISLMTFAGADNALAMEDHDDHIHVGFHADGGLQPPSQEAGRVGAESWRALLAGPGAVEPPTVASKRSPLATRPVKP